MKVFISRLLMLFLCLQVSIIAWAQIPAPSNLNGNDLKAWLKANYYDGKHITLGYNGATGARGRMYNFIDNKNNTIVGVYSGYVKSWNAGGTGTNPDPINCEHTVPQSFFGKAEPMRSDIHHLFPTYKNWNSTRSNYPFGEINDSQTTKWMRNTSSLSSIPSSNIDEYSEYANQTFEPREDHKGNVARAVFYFYTMYPTQAGNISRIGDINTLYQWHLDDPVDANERARNSAIEQYQGDRNPYVDYPDLVGRAWGFTTGGGGGGTVTYCASKGNSVADEWISRVQFGSINRSSGANGGYADFTSSSTSIAQGASATITITPSWSGTAYNEGYAVFIDFNKDGDFNDVGETVYTRSATSTTPISGTINIPTSAATGATRMRVSMKYNGVPTACEAFSYGEVEDYTINITTGSGGGADTQAPSAPSSLSSSNVTTSSVTLSWSASSDNVGVTGYRIYQNGSSIGTVTGTSSNITSLTAGTTYSFYIRAYDAAGNTSGNSNSINVTTQSNASNGCTGDISSFPYTATLENNLNGWTQDNTDDLNWTFRSGTTPSSNTGPSSAAQGSYYLYVEASGNTGYPNKGAILTSPCFNLSSASQATFSFAYHMYGASDMGTFALQASTNNGATWTSVWSDSGNQGNQWNTASVNLSAYLGGTVKLRFNRVTGGTWQADIAIDNFNLSTTGSSGGSGGGSGNASDLFISEYVEGSSYNKGIEIANLTGSSVDLSQYSLRKQTNGSGSWVTLNLNGTLANGQVYVVVNNQANATMQGVANVSTSSSVMTFNGNDPVALFKGSTLIDIVGAFNGGSANFAQNTTLVRKSSITGPNSTYTTGEWDQYSSDTFSFFGQLPSARVTRANIEIPQQAELKIYPVPATKVVNVAFGGQDVEQGELTIVSLSGKVVYNGSLQNGNNSIEVSSWKKGVYLLKIQKGNQVITKRIIVQ